MGRINRGNYIYISLLLVRLIVSFTSTSFIHPDEYFQSTEVTSPIIFPSFSNSSLTTWEWNPSNPCRSIVPIYLTTALPFWVLKAWTNHPSAKQLFLSTRLGSFAFSLIIDFFIVSLSYPSPTTPLILFSTSPVLLTFLLRPFTNSFESLLLASALFVLNKLLFYQSSTRGWITSLGVVLALGVWTRITFVAFVGPVVAGVLVLIWERSEGKRRRFWSFVYQLLPLFLSFSFTALLLTVIDSLYFSSFPSLSITPLNSLLYNISTSNLSSHGIHPRYLHLLVNYPMLFGIGVWGVWKVGRESWRWWGVDEWSGKRRTEKGKKEFVKRVCLETIGVSIGILSIIPHQEPRFLAPLIIPVVIVVAFSNRITKKFWVGWILHSIIFTTLFGYLHQGGLIPSLLKLNSKLALIPSPPPTSVPTPVNLVFWKTFMPPRHLILPIPPPSFLISITDLSGSSLSVLYSTLNSFPETSITLLIAPEWALPPSLDPYQTSEEEEGCLSENLWKNSGLDWQVDMDRLREVWKGGWGTRGVGVWEVEGDCSG